MQQRQASPHTISSYRDSFRQFLKFVQRLRKPPSRLTFEEIDAPLIVAFLDELEKHHGVSVRSRNLRLTAIHSFFRFTAFEAPNPFPPQNTRRPPTPNATPNEAAAPCENIAPKRKTGALSTWRPTARVPQQSVERRKPRRLCRVI